MIEEVAGHVYLLDNLKDSSITTLAFYQDPDLHNGEGREGPSTQEVIRACIYRVRHLDREKRWKGNDEIVFHLRSAIALFEARAMQRKVEKGVAIEKLPTGKDGHIT